MNILVTIASFGNRNDQHLHRLIREYRRMKFEVDIVVLSNVAKTLDADIEVIVGLPSKDPWSLPFGHKQVLASRVDSYDLFIYSEDDTLITEQNICSFISATELLPSDKIAGFLRSEVDSGDDVFYSTVNSFFRWDASSVFTAGGRTFAYFSNEHSACYMLTQSQLRRAIASGGFLVGPHEGRYDLLVSAATDPYTQCGFRKMVCISDLDAFTVRHLTNKYIGRMGVSLKDVQRQLTVLLGVRNSGTPIAELFTPETKVHHALWSKPYYEAARCDVLELVPSSAKSVLSVGCTYGATEGELVRSGKRVVGVPMDPVIGSCAEAKGVEIVCGDFGSARQALLDQKFDCILMLDVLHLVEDPVAIVSAFRDLLSSDGILIATVPNLSHLSVRFHRVLRHHGFEGIGDFERSGVHVTSLRAVAKWLVKGGLLADKVVGNIPKKWALADRVCLKLANDMWATSLLATGRLR